jgi:hypothetical protein
VSKTPARICCGVTKTALMVRVGPEAREWALAQAPLF